MQKELISYEFRRHSEDPFGHEDAHFNGLSLGHIALHNSPNENAGDTILPQAIRGIFDVVQGQFGWHYYHLWDKYSKKVVEQINKDMDGLVIGGGGFIIKDQWGTDIRRSGWSWNISLEELKALQTPYCLFGVGYNRFRNQEDFDPHFADHISLTVEKAVFVGLRNTGSIRKVSEYMNDPSLKEKIKLQYCPTTASYQIWPEYGQKSDGFETDFGKRSKPVLAFNFSGDRLEMRFNNEVDKGMTRLASAIKKVEDSGWDIVLVTHKYIDRQIEPFLDKAEVTYVTHDLTFANHYEMMDFYAQVDLVTGMRGHSQLVPLGLRKPIISIISHNKMAYLLEDIKHEEWGVDVNNPDWDDELVEKINHYGINQRAKTLEDIVIAQTECWESSKRNVEFITQEFRKSKK